MLLQGQSYQSSSGFMAARIYPVVLVTRYTMVATVRKIQ